MPTWRGWSCAGSVEAPTRKFAGYIAQRLQAALSKREVDARVLGPAPAPIPKLRGKYRYQVQVQSRDTAGLHAALAEATSDLKPPGDVQWIVDVDPIEML